MSSQNTPRQYCSQISAQAGEPLPGTATRTQVYFLLEYPGSWGEKAFEEAALPQAVKDYLSAYLHSIQDARILLIRGEPGPVQAPHFFVALLAEGSEALYEFPLADYASLLGLDLAGLLNDPEIYRDYRRVAPLFLVCTHGRRDACCSRYGLPVYQALRASLGESVWQCSHVGGHRFAANLLCFPAGVLYGRVGPENAIQLLHATLNYQVELEYYRGRVAYPPAAQTAEYELRKMFSQPALQAYRLFSVEETDPGRWRARFLDITTRQTHQLVLRAEKTEPKVYESCRLEKQVPVITYRLEDFKSFDPPTGVA